MSDMRFDSLVESFTEQQKYRSELEMQVQQLNHMKVDKTAKIDSLTEAIEKLISENISREKSITDLIQEKTVLELDIQRERASRSDMSFTLKAMEDRTQEKHKEFQTLRNSNDMALKTTSERFREHQTTLENLCADEKTVTKMKSFLYAMESNENRLNGDVHKGSR